MIVLAVAVVIVVLCGASLALWKKGTCYPYLPPSQGGNYNSYKSGGLPSLPGVWILDPNLEAHCSRHLIALYKI